MGLVPAKGDQNFQFVQLTSILNAKMHVETKIAL
jgi:hypothetical protein